jgi:anti-anti-sigma factor
MVMKVEYVAEATADIVSVCGEIDMANVQTLERALAARARPLIIDLDRVDYVDSAGIRALLGAVDGQQRLGTVCLLVAEADTAAALVLRVSGVGSEYVCATVADAKDRIKRS